jgi:cytochrome c peroxidase
MNVVKLKRLGLFIAGTGLAVVPVLADPLPPDASYRPLPTLPFATVKANDEAAKPAVMQRQQGLLEQRYDLADRPVPGQMMSGNRKPVQGGVRVKLPQGVTWTALLQ